MSLKISDIKPQETYRLKPNLSKRGRFAKHIGHPVVVTKCYWNSVQIKVLADNALYSYVSPKSLTVTEKGKNIRNDFLLKSLEEAKNELLSEIEKKEKGIEKINGKIEFVKSTGASKFNDQDYKRWRVKQVLKKNQQEELFKQLETYL